MEKRGRPFLEGVTTAKPERREAVKMHQAHIIQAQMSNNLPLAYNVIYSSRLHRFDITLKCKVGFRTKYVIVFFRYLC